MELLVALALGLVVIAAALGFLLQILRAGSEIVLSARLQQELRTSMAVVVAEVRRARAGGGDVVASPGCLVGTGIAISLRDGALRVARGPGVDCEAAGEGMGSPAVRMTALRFTHEVSVNDRRVQVELAGALRSSPAFFSLREVRLRQVVALRSNGGG
ncbi:hypothetical protein LF41_657 [Lysobacter dokdonensis DS-58]|uniref:Uncharacterized protein n=1 Tax=Lysobacter dokdonensis DS-58 TaxID=1300345 RepID=A0A0A2WIT7_9GAMM|nr:hypothetical protein LF41_657 [Lysobacter dokdonensis DS-58]